MNVIKRNGEEVVFDINKITNAISKANDKMKSEDKLNITTIELISQKISTKCDKLNRAINVEEIQDMVELELHNNGASFNLLKEYVTYRYKRSLERKANTTDARILSIIEGTNEEATQENANKDPQIASTQRDYIAGEVSNDLCRRYIYPQKAIEAHDDGIIHIHDMTNRIHKVFNCCLVNLEDMLQNGTVISGTKIDRPHSFATACNIATQIVAIVSSGQYGGTTITLSHLAPFVQESRFRIGKRLIIEAEDVGLDLTEEQFNKMVEHRLMHEIKDGVQTIQYQLNTLSTSNGQTPFVSVALFLNEAKNEQEKKDLALIIEEVLKQRIQGIKNEDGVYVTNAFPKLLYLVCEDNCAPDRPYWNLTVLSAMCTAKRMVPDYISEKIMLQDKLDKNGIGASYPCMG